ncbi:MAG: O-antigen ligase family protein [Anaerolineales bacterium]|nr:O-antigen ligase family protein [Anaerolineales bacterium]
MKLRLGIDTSRLLLPLVIIAVLAASGLAGWARFSEPDKMFMAVLAGAGGISLVLLAIREMRLALTLLVLTAGVVGFSIGTGTQSAINVAMLLTVFLAGMWALRMITKKQVRLAPSPLNWPLLGFLAAALISWIASYVVLDPAVTLPGNILVVQAGQFIIFLLTAAAFFLAANHAPGERLLQIWVVFLILTGTGVLVVRTFTDRYDFLSTWAGGLLTWPFVLLLGQVLFNQAMKWQVKAAGLGVIALWAHWVWTVTLSYKSAWAPALGAFLLLILLNSRRLFLVILLLLVVAVIVVGPGRIWSALLVNEHYSATPIRWSLWVDVFRMGARSVILGLGPANYIYYWQILEFESVSYQYVSPSAFMRSVYAPPAHNMYADVFAQTGILGLAFLVWAIVAGLWLGIRVLKRPLTPFQRAYAYSVLVGFAALSVASFVFAEWLLPYVYNLGLAGFRNSVYSWLLLGTLVGLGAENQPAAEGAA